jgi:hypothetical protein
MNNTYHKIYRVDWLNNGHYSGEDNDVEMESYFTTLSAAKKWAITKSGSIYIVEVIKPTKKDLVSWLNNAGGMGHYRHSETPYLVEKVVDRTLASGNQLK